MTGLMQLMIESGYRRLMLHNQAVLLFLPHSKSAGSPNTQLALLRTLMVAPPSTRVTRRRSYCGLCITYSPKSQQPALSAMPRPFASVSSSER